MWKVTKGDYLWMQTLKLQFFPSPTAWLPCLRSTEKQRWELFGVEKSLECLLTQRYLQAYPVPPERQNNLNHGLMIHLVLLDPHCKCMKWIRSCLIHSTHLFPFLIPSRLQEAPNTVTALRPITKDQSSAVNNRKSRRDPGIVGLCSTSEFIWGEWLNRLISSSRIPLQEPNSVQTLCRKTWAQIDGGENPAQCLNDEEVWWLSVSYEAALRRYYLSNLYSSGVFFLAPLLFLLFCCLDGSLFIKPDWLYCVTA